MHDGIRGIGLSCSVAPGVVHDGGVGPRRKGNIDWIQGWKKRRGCGKMHVMMMTEEGGSRKGNHSSYLPPAMTDGLLLSSFSLRNS